MKLKILKTLKILIIKFSSVAIMGGIFLFLWIHGGFGGIGEFAAVTAIIAPLGVFSQFRYVEYIALNENKKIALYCSLYSSLIIFLILSFGFLIIQEVFFGFSFLFLLAIFYKLFEMFFEFQNAYFVSINKISYAIWINIFRIINIVLMYLIYTFFFLEYNSLLYCFSFLILSNLILFIFSGVKFFKIDAKTLISYIKLNYSYGFTSMFVSLNSLVPRYFYMAVGDSKGLGIFTIIYLFSSTSVNIFQYLFSVKVKYLEGLYLSKKHTIKKITLFLILLPLFFIYINESYALIVMSFFLMFVFMLIRGALITVNIVWAEKSKINMSVIIGMVVSFLVILLCILIYQEEINIGLASFYICLSSWVTAMVLLYNKKRFIK